MRHIIRTVTAHKSFGLTYRELPKRNEPTSKLGGFQEKLRNVFGSKDQNTQVMSEEEMKQQAERNLHKQYMEMAKSIETMQDDNEKLKVALADIYRDIKQTIESSYEIEAVKVIMDLVPPKSLCHFAIEQFIGSITNPKNEVVMRKFLAQAEKNCKTDEERLEVEYYTAYLSKLSAIQAGDKEGFEIANEKMVDLCDQKHPLAMHLTAKEMYKVALNIVTGKQKRNKREMMSEASRLFDIASQNGSYQSFYYLGEMAEQGDIAGGFDFNYAYECFLIAASFDNPKAYFKLAQYHKTGTGCEKNDELVFYYMKKAAELGLVDAQHNLGCIYMEKRLVPYDSLKSLAWFTQAAAAGYPHSMYNAARIYLEGGEDGKVKVNLQAGLVWLESLQKTGSIDVDDKIEEVVKAIERMREERKQRLQSKEGVNRIGPASTQSQKP